MASSVLLRGEACSDRGVRMRKADRMLGVVDSLEDGSIADVGKIDQNAYPVHLAHRGPTDLAQSLIGAFPAAVAEEVALVVR